MSAYKKKSWLFAGMLISICAPAAHGQLYDYVDTPDHELQFFAPVDLDFENLPIKRTSGFTFRFDKLSWAMTGERNVVGNEDVVAFSEVMYPEELDDFLNVSDANAPAQYQIINGIRNAAPNAEFGWGERYEFGYRYKNHSWDVSILDGPMVTSISNYGNGPELTGFGSIHINFATPDDYLIGFRDYWDGQGGDGETEGDFLIGIVGSGPGLLEDEIADDLDGDGVQGVAVFLDADDNPIGLAVDFDDLHMFNIRFNQLLIRNRTETQGIEIMHTHYLTNRHKMVKHQNNNLEFGYGVRFLMLEDEFFFDGTSDLLGSMQFETETENQIVGPQVRLKWSTQRKNWNFAVDGRCLFGYNIVDLGHRGFYGLDTELVNDDGTVIATLPGMIPGGLNNLVSAQPTTYDYGRRDNEFSPVIELRADLSYQMTRSVAARLGYTAIFIDNLSRASQVTDYSLPNMGLLQGGEQDIFINGANFGFDVNY